MFYTGLNEAVQLVQTGGYVFTGLERMSTSSYFFNNSKEYELSDDESRARNVWLPEQEAMILAQTSSYTIVGEHNSFDGKLYELAYNG